MGMLTDIYTLVKELKESGSKGSGIYYKTKKDSLSKKAKDSTFQFPVIATNTLSIDDISMVSKALERQYASFTRVAMGLDNDIRAKDSVVDHINKFHQNTDKSAMFGGIDGVSSRGFHLSEESLQPYCEDLRLDSINSKTIRNNNGIKKNVSSLFFSESAKLNTRITPLLEDGPPMPTFGVKLNGQDRMLLDNDVKKSNEMVPTLMNVRINRELGSGIVSEDFIIGIKTIIHPVSGEEMVESVTSTIKRKRAFFRTVQFTTGEISFFKDYLFMLNDIKKDATRSRADSPWWRTLKVRAAQARLSRFSFSKHELLPNSTLVLTMDEVEFINNSYNINLLKDKKAIRTLLDELFLLGFVIVDPSAEISYFFFDSESEFQTYSFNALERENKNSNNEVKSLVSMMNKL